MKYSFLNVKTYRTSVIYAFLGAGLMLSACSKSPQTIFDNYQTAETAWLSVQEQAAKDANSQSEFLAMMKAKAGKRPDVKPALEASLAIAEQDPKSNAAFAALLFIVEKTAATKERSTWISRVLPLLREQHMHSPEMLDVAYTVSETYNDSVPRYESFMQDVAAQHPDPYTRANTWYYLARAHYRFINSAEMHKEERQSRKERALKYIANIKAEADFTDASVYDPNIPNPAEDMVLLSDRLDRLAFLVEHVSVGSIIPNIAMQDMQSRADQISNYKGKVVIIDFWATWCGPCVATIPKLAKIKREYDAQPFEILSISVDDDIQDAREFQEDTDMPWAQWFVGRDGQLVKDWNLTAFPTYILLDKQGRIQYISNVITDDFQAKIKELL